MDMARKKSRNRGATPAEGQNHEHVVKSAAQPFNEIPNGVMMPRGHGTEARTDNDYQCAA